MVSCHVPSHPVVGSCQHLKVSAVSAKRGTSHHCVQHAHIIRQIKTCPDTHIRRMIPRRLRKVRSTATRGRRGPRLPFAGRPSRSPASSACSFVAARSSIRSSRPPAAPPATSASCMDSMPGLRAQQAPKAVRHQTQHQVGPEKRLGEPLLPNMCFRDRRMTPGGLIPFGCRHTLARKLAGSASIIQCGQSRSMLTARIRFWPGESLLNALIFPACAFPLYLHDVQSHRSWGVFSYVKSERAHTQRREWFLGLKLKPC